MEKIGDKLYDLRMKYKMTQNDFAERIGVSRQTVSVWEANRNQIPADKLKLICEEFDVTPDYFLSDDNSNISQQSQSNENDAVVCDEYQQKQENQNEQVDIETIPQEGKKRLGKTNKILITVLVIAVIIGVITAVCIKMLMYNDVEGFQSATSTTYYFNELFWLIPGVAGLAVVIVVAKLIKINKKQKK